MSLKLRKLIRGTVIGLVMVMSLGAAALVQGAMVTLSNGGACEYSSMTVQPNGAVAVQCVGGPVVPTPPAPPAPPAPLPATGCPAPQPGYRTVHLGWTSTPNELRMPSGAIATFPIAAKPGGTHASVRLSQGQVAVSPGGYTEFTVSKCPGVIIPEAGSCYRKVQAGNYASAPDAYTRATAYGWDTQAELDSRLSCWAPSAEGQWYVNVRWTYTTTNCPYGCGYSMQWFEGSY